MAGDENFFEVAAIESWDDKAFGGNAGLAIVDDASPRRRDDGGVKMALGMTMKGSLPPSSRTLS